MAAVLQAYDDVSRKVWVLDSFEGCPEPDPEEFPQDAHDKHYTFKNLQVSVHKVARHTQHTHTHTHIHRERDRHTQTHIYTNLKGTNDNHHTFENRTYKVSVDKVARHLTKLLRMWRLAPCVSEAAHTSHLT